MQIITNSYLGINLTKDVQALPKDQYKTLLNGRREKLNKNSLIGKFNSEPMPIPNLLSTLLKHSEIAIRIPNYNSTEIDKLILKFLYRRSESKEIRGIGFILPAINNISNNKIGIRVTFIQHD